MEAPGATNDEHTYTIVENIGEASHSDVDTRGVEAAFIGEEEGEASDEDQLQTKNLVVYEVGNIECAIFRFSWRKLFCPTIYFSENLYLHD